MENKKMSIKEQIMAKARTKLQTIVFPEGDEPRTIQAAAILQQEHLVRPVLLGDPSVILMSAGRLSADLQDIDIIDPKNSPKAEAYAETLFELRRAKGLSREAAGELAEDSMYYGIMMVHMGDADGLVSGAVHTTGDMLRPALQVIRTKPGTKVVSSSLLVEMPNKNVGHNGLFLFSDCVVIPCPTAEELAHIAVSSAETARVLGGIENPKVALLSFSTKGSAKHELVTKVKDAVDIAHSLAPDLLLDGELQFDAAIVPEVAALKAKGSPVAGSANVLIFPDLQAGNIGYKIAQRLGGAEAVAVLQGLNKPCNDLSRGCSVDDIVMTAAITAVQGIG